MILCDFAGNKAELSFKNMVGLQLDIQFSQKKLQNEHGHSEFQKLSVDDALWLLVEVGRRWEERGVGSPHNCIYPGGANTLIRPWLFCEMCEKQSKQPAAIIITLDCLPIL